MTLTLDAATEKRMQQEIDLGHYTNVSELVAHAVSLLPAQPPTTPEKSSPRKPTPIKKAFGLWADRNIDGISYQETLRAEWYHHRRSS